MSLTSQASLIQDSFQYIQEFRDQYMAMIMVCDELELCFVTWESDTKSVLNE